LNSKHQEQMLTDDVWNLQANLGLELKNVINTARNRCVTKPLRKRWLLPTNTVRVTFGSAWGRKAFSYLRSCFGGECLPLSWRIRATNGLARGSCASTTREIVRRHECVYGYGSAAVRMMRSRCSVDGDIYPAGTARLRLSNATTAPPPGNRRDGPSLRSWWWRRQWRRPRGTMARGEWRTRTRATDDTRRTHVVLLLLLSADGDARACNTLRVTGFYLFFGFFLSRTSLARYKQRSATVVFRPLNDASTTSVTVNSRRIFPFFFSRGIYTWRLRKSNESIDNNRFLTAPDGRRGHIGRHW